jgi:hypothetical protein
MVTEWDSALPGPLPEARYRLNICVRIIQLVAEKFQSELQLQSADRMPGLTQTYLQW